MSSSNRLIASILVIATLAIGFWMLALGPKREKADQLGRQVDQLNVSLAEAESAAGEAAAARRSFPADYRQLVVLGQAVPAEDETSSLLVELNHIAAKSKVKFESIQLSGSGETAAAPAATSTPPAPTSPSTGSPSAVPASASIPPTEVAASLLPLGASIGPAGLAVMPYTLTFSGNFFHIADFISGLDSLVHANGSTVAVDGRLLTLDGFALNEEAEGGFPHLEASFSVTAYVTPPSQGITAGATTTEPPTASPAEAPTSGGSSETSQTVSAR